MTPDEAHQELLRLRASIDNLDAALVHLLAERFKCTEQVGRLKAQATLSTGTTATTTQGNALQDNGSSVGLSYQFEY